ncbi:DoxX family protein [Amorphus sp. 3PC139-8]|uniref:DoxX family protein n=1 Tax=Amorphus sp. 3PC139-8 TaxID=2735676 RepID=UPI00345D9221
MKAIEMERDTLAVEPRTQNRTAHLGLWALRILLALAFVLFAVMKLAGREAMIVEFDMVGLGQWFRYFTGLLELTGAIALLIPAVSVLGAVLLLIVDLGAFVAQVTILHIDWIHTVAIAALLGAVIYLQRSSLSRWLGRSSH